MSLGLEGRNWADTAVVGIDAGSRAVKIVSGCGGREWRAEAVIEAATFYREYCSSDPTDSSSHPSDSSNLFSWKALLDEVGSRAPDKIVATGYGKVSAVLEGATRVNEIIAHAAGARFLTGLDDFLLLDIGGQDTKVAVVSAGELADVDTNDKCAASCGRFVENMAALLGCTMDEMSLHRADPVALSSTCAVFAESEVIDLLAQGVQYRRIASGVNSSIVSRIEPMLRRMWRGEPIVFSGGVARNGAVADGIRGILGARVVVPAEPEMTGAIGCLIIGSSRESEAYEREGSRHV